MATPAPTMFKKINQKLYSGIDYLDKTGKKIGVEGTKSLARGVGSTVKGTLQLGIGVASLPIMGVKSVLNAPTKKWDNETIDTGTEYLGQKMGNLKRSLIGKAESLDSIPSFYKILFLIFFYIFFYKIIFDMGIFFGLNTIDMVIYMAWFGILLLFLSFIRSKRSRLYN